MTDPVYIPDGHRTDARTHLAWLMWCFSEGYTTAFDREIIENADEVLAALAVDHD